MEEIREEITEEEIRNYVDMLIDRHRFSYDQRLAPLLYEFFLRSHRTFHWSKDEFLDKYINFSNTIKKIKFTKLPEGCGAVVNHREKAMKFDKSYLLHLKKADEETYQELIDFFNHESTHATDSQKRDGKLIKDGLYEIDKGKQKNTFTITKEGEIENSDTCLNEYVNIVTACVLSSGQGMYYGSAAVVPNLRGYYSLHGPGTIFCAAFDVPEKKLAELKDQGRKAFDQYFEEQYPFIKTDVVIESFRDHFNTIHNAFKNDDKENIILGYEGMLDMAGGILANRIKDAFYHGKDEEFVQRTFFNLNKINHLIISAKELYSMGEKDLWSQQKTVNDLLGFLHFYKKYEDHKEELSQKTQETILADLIATNQCDVELLQSHIGKETYDEPMGYEIEEIAEKYYSDLAKPLNDNTELIKQLKKEFMRPTLKERFESIKKKFKKGDAVPILEPPAKEREKEQEHIWKRGMRVETLSVSHKEIQKTAELGKKEQKEGEAR